MSNRRAEIRRQQRRKTNPATLPAVTRAVLHDGDADAGEAFRNFLGWGIAPKTHRPPASPAWFAYALGLTRWCPPKGEL